VDAGGEDNWGENTVLLSDGTPMGNSEKMGNPKAKKRKWVGGAHHLEFFYQGFNEKPQQPQARGGKDKGGTGL